MEGLPLRAPPSKNVKLTALGGADTITVNDLGGTDVKQVAVDLAAVAGSGQDDGQTDAVIVNGSAAAADQIKVVSSGASVSVNGLAAQVTVTGAGATSGPPSGPAPRCRH